MLATLDIILVIAYFVAIVIVGYLSSRKESEEEFLIGNKKIGIWHNIATLTATKITASLFITYVALVYVFGIGALWIFIGAGFGYLLFLLFGIKLKKEGDKYNYYSIADYFYHHYGYFTGKLSSITIFLITFLNFTIQIIGGAIILENLIDLSFFYGVLIVSGVILFYLYIGGFKAVVKTDVVQFVSIVLLLVILGIFLFTNFSYEPSQWSLLSPGIGIIISFFIVGVLFPFSAPDLWQRVLAAKSVKALKKSFVLTTIFYVLFGALLSFIAIIIKLKLPGIDANAALVQGFIQLLPAGLLGLALIPLFAAIMSSADSFAFICGGLLMHDIIFRNKEYDKVSLLKYGILVTIFSGTVLALSFQSILKASYLFAGIFMVFSIIIITTWIKPSVKPIIINSGIILGIIITIIFALFKGISTNLIVIGVIGGIIGMIAGAIVSKSIKRKKLG
ncbi:MAG: hypothetical protein ABIB71_00385 [Candidatus Woesearchaeota archaeon]